MAMKKAEMESHQAEYHALIFKARSALSGGHYDQAVKLAMASWAFIDGMMQFERKYEGKQFESVEGIDLVLQYAPLLFDSLSLDRLEELLRDERRIDKHASDDLAERLEQARTQMWDAHRLWNHLERSRISDERELLSQFGGNTTTWRSILDFWDQIGVVRRIVEGQSFRVELSTRMDSLIRAKCPSCGAIGKALKAKLLDELACPKCQSKAFFVLLAEQTASAN